MKLKRKDYYHERKRLQKITRTENYRVVKARGYDWHSSNFKLNLHHVTRLRIS